MGMTTSNDTIALSSPGRVFEIHLLRTVPRSPIWSVDIHIDRDDIIDHKPIWRTRMAFSTEVAFDEHWLSSDELASNEGTQTRVPAEFLESIEEFITAMTTREKNM